MAMTMPASAAKFRAHVVLRLLQAITAAVLADTDASDEPMWGRGNARLRYHATRRGHVGESDSSDHLAEESDSAGSEPDADSQMRA